MSEAPRRRCPRIERRHSGACLDAGNRYQSVTLLSTHDGKRAKAMGEHETASKTVNGEVREYTADAVVHLHRPMTSEEASRYFKTESGSALLALYEGVWGGFTAEPRGGK